MNYGKVRWLKPHSWPAVTLWCLLSSSIVLLALASGGPTAAARGQPRRSQPAELIRPYDKNGAFYGGELWSPDQRYIASAKRIEAGVVNLTILDARTRKPLVFLKDANGFVWVPRHRHRLVAAASGAYGKPFLGMWEGGSSFKSLRPVRRPQREYFELYGVTSDGRFAVYRHDTNTEAANWPTPAEERRRRRLQLPAK